MDIEANLAAYLVDQAGGHDQWPFQLAHPLHSFEVEVSNDGARWR